ncbi:MAG: ATP-binding protein [Thermodesulfovibrionales bacterium]|jgi:two-component system nitrogen regulation sensor histidine kinase GlnL|nr:ATP-binding protein [Thermodesulfovibrionales bacterium]
MVFLDAVINNLDEAIFLFDKKGRLIFINKAGEEFFGRSNKEIKHRQFKDLFSDAKDIAMLIQKTITEGRSFNCKEMEVDIGRAANIDLNLTPFYYDDSSEGFSKWGSHRGDESPTCAHGAILCIRENLSLTEREDYQFDSLLYLLGSIAHEIKNPLSGIKGAAQILMTNLAHGSSPIAQNKNNEAMSQKNYLEAEECVDMILKETDRLNSVLHSYLTMTRMPVFNKLNIHEVLEHALKVMKTSIEKKRITVNKSYDPSLPNIAGDESKLLQVFINLLKNAAEAMKTSRSRMLRISTRPSNEYMVIYENSGAGRKNTKTKKQRWVVVSIEDTGMGIPKDEINRIFLPFYTKKDGGSGLGLALSKKIVKDHGGIIKVKSKEGAGAIFSIYLPMTGEGK